MNYVNELRHLADSLGDVNPYWCDADVDMLREAADRLAAAEAREQELRMELAIEKAFNTDTELYYRLLAKRDEAAKGGRDEL